MRKKYLIIKVWIIHKLQKLKILPNVWYGSEIDLAKIRGKEIADFLAKGKPSPPHYSKTVDEHFWDLK